MRLDLRTKAQVKRTFVKSVKSWQERFWLRDWELNIDVLDEPPKGKANVSDAGVMKANAAETVVSSEYETATITGFLPILMDFDDKRIDRMAAHEVGHILLDPLHDLVCELMDQLPSTAREAIREKMRQTVEVTATRLEKVMWHAYGRGK